MKKYAKWSKWTRRLGCECCWVTVTDRGSYESSVEVLWDPCPHHRPGAVEAGWSRKRSVRAVRLMEGGGRTQTKPASDPYR